jgi:hypothetical protein
MISLQGHVGEDEEGKQIKVEAHLPGWVAEVLKVQARRVEPG